MSTKPQKLVIHKHAAKGLFHVSIHNTDTKPVNMSWQGAAATGPDPGCRQQCGGIGEGRRHHGDRGRWGRDADGDTDGHD